jgi:drug/metabolite transporter (DMT)-like permease
MTRPTTLRGILFMLVAIALFALMDAGLKLLTAHYAPLQVAALRGLASMPLVLVWVLATVGAPALVRVRWPLHLLRGVLAIAMMFGFTFAVSRLPLSEAYAVFFVAPLMVTALAVPLLGERVSPARWIAIGVGLVGVLVVLRPTGAGMNLLGGAAMVLAAACYALSAITVRALARTETTQAMVFWMVTMLGTGSFVLALLSGDWQPVQLRDAWLIAGIGVTGALGQYAVTEAFRHGEASVIAPFEYTALAWSLLLDLLLWGVLPDRVVWIGAAIIVCSGLYLIRQEKVHAEAEHP